MTIRCHILKLKCTKSDFGWDSAPDPAGGAYSAPLDHLAGYKWFTSKGRGGSERRKRDEKGGEKGKKWEGGRRSSPPLQFYFDHWKEPCVTLHFMYSVPSVYNEGNR